MFESKKSDRNPIEFQSERNKLFRSLKADSDYPEPLVVWEYHYRNIMVMITIIYGNVNHSRIGRITLKEGFLSI